MTEAIKIDLSLVNSKDCPFDVFGKAMPAAFGSGPVHASLVWTTLIFILKWVTAFRPTLSVTYLVGLFIC